MFTFLFTSTPSSAEETTGEPTFENLVEHLKQQSFKKKIAAIKQLSALDDERVLPVMVSMLNSDLFYRKEDKLVVIAVKKDEGYEIQNVVTQEI
ncbi:MAG: hypothetical protein P8Y24_03310, partial [Gammaproteobacteria bacterium]